MNYSRVFHLQLVFWCVAFFLFLFWSFPETGKTEESSCVSCHTSAGELIRITREIAASRPKVEKSAETAGEG
jgi:hypothetical protein